MDKDTSAGVKVFGCGMIGLILAMIWQTLYTNGVVVDEFVTGTIQSWEVMALIIIVWLIIGVVVAIAT
jgi:hypothetical protein